MNKRVLGKVGIEIPEIGYGAAALFGKDVLGKQGITEDQAYELISMAITNGVTFFDSGINYGYAEERLGRCITNAIDDKKIMREDLIIETKCGETIKQDGTYGHYDFSPDWIKRSLEISLKRLRLEYVDLFAMHGGSIADCSDKLIYCFQDMKSQGLIKAYGINSFDTTVLDWVAANETFDYVMLDYNIIRQDREPLIDKMHDKGIGVIAGMALGQSLFTKNIYRIKNRNDIWYFLRTMAHFRNNLKKSKDFRFLTKEKDYTANQLALRYVLDNSGICSAVFSTISVEHFCENIKAADIKMPEEIRKQIKEHK